MNHKVVVTSMAILVVGLAVLLVRRGCSTSDRPATPRSASTATARAPARGAAAANARLEPSGAPLASALRLEGQIVDPGGEPVAGAEVVLERKPPRSVTSEADGTFVFDRLAPGTYQMSAQQGDLLGGPVVAELTEHSEPVVIRLGRGATVRVVVTSSAGTPISGATVHGRVGIPAGRRFVTDERGTVVLAPVQPGWVGVEVTAPGYAPELGTAVVGSPGATSEIAITLREGVGVTGRVIDDRGAPVVGARVTAAATMRGTLESADSITDARGVFAIRALANGEYVLRAVDGEHAPAQSPPLTVAGRSIDNVELVMASGGVIWGVVVDTARRPVPFAHVSLLDQALPATGTGELRDAVADRQGAFELHGLPRHIVHVHADAEGAASSVVELDLSRQPAFELSLVLELTGKIAGIVVNQTGEPVPEVQVIARPDLSAGVGAIPPLASRSSVATTGGDGRFRVSGLWNGTYRLVATRRSGGVAALAGPGEAATLAHTGDADVRVVLASPGRLVGRVRLADSSIPPKLATVSVGTGIPITAVGGVFAIEELSPGTYPLQIQGPEFTDTLRPGIVIQSGRTTDVGTVIVTRGRVQSGRVVDGSGAPVAGARVKLGVFRSETHDGFGFASLAGLRSSTTDASGGFSIAGVPTAPMDLIAYDPERGISEPVHVPGGLQDPPVVTLRLQTGPR